MKNPINHSFSGMPQLCWYQMDRLNKYIIIASIMISIANSVYIFFIYSSVT